jgi:hypothetical protein
LEHSSQEHHQHRLATFGHADIAKLAHQLWETRGSPNGSPEDDWFQAAHNLRARNEGLQR